MGRHKTGFDKLVYDRAYGKAYRATRLTQESLRTKAWREADPRRFLDSRYRSQYGKSLVELEELLAFQGGGCGICATPLSLELYAKNKAVVDHDHKTGEIRGLLCQRCNRGLAHFEDSIEGLERARTYLNTPPAVLKSNGRSLPRDLGTT